MCVVYAVGTRKPVFPRPLYRDFEDSAAHRAFSRSETCQFISLISPARHFTQILPLREADTLQWTTWPLPLEVGEHPTSALVDGNMHVVTYGKKGTRQKPSLLVRTGSALRVPRFPCRKLASFGFYCRPPRIPSCSFPHFHRVLLLPSLGRAFR